MAQEVQLTFGPYNHSLDNNDNFSPDGDWLVYDTRTAGGGIKAGRTIEKVHVRTKEVVTLYDAPGVTDSGPGIGAVSYHPHKPQVCFIHGLLNHTADHPYAWWRRFGMLLDESRPDRQLSAEARDVVAPFTPGALRGGTHRHEFSGDGQWIGFTYNDELMAEKGEPFNLRTIGVMQFDRPVLVPSPRGGSNFNGLATAALVVRVTPEPRPGSDEISRAASDSWIGTHGYRREDGQLQLARAFLGTVCSASGQDVQELFVVDIPNDITTPGPYGPLEGTRDQMPMPPAGTRQRRLTHTTQNAHPGFSGNVRSSPDGTKLALLGKDDQEITQVMLASPLDGNPVPLTTFDSSVQSDCRWHPNGQHICFAQANRMMIANVQTGKVAAATESAAGSPVAPVWSRDGSTIAFNRAVTDPSSGRQFTQVFIVRPETLP